MIWKGWAAVYLFLELLEFWRILFLKIFKILHDEFLYDDSLKSYHNHIYMLIRLWTIYLLFTAYEHWVWSSCVDPQELVMRLKSKFTCTFTHTCCFYSGSTHPHTSTHFDLQIHQKLFYSYPGENSQKLFPIPIIPCEINARDVLVTTTCYIILGGWVLWKKREKGYEEIKRGKCPEPRKKRKSETRGKNGQVFDSRIKDTRYHLSGKKNKI